MIDQTTSFHDFLGWLMAAAALWLLFRLYQLTKAIHFMLQKWFSRDFLGGRD